MRKVFVYRNELLPVSETFIRAQAAALTRFHPIYVGLRKPGQSLAIPGDSILLSRGSPLMSRVKGLLYKATGYAPRFHARARKVGANLLHAHFSADGVSALPLASATRLPMIVTLHGNDVTTTERAYRQSVVGQIYLLKRKRLWRKASAFLCISDFIKEKAIEAGFPEHKLRVHYIGVDLELFRPPTSDQQRSTVLFVGRLVEKKGCTYLIQAMQEVQERFPSAKLVVIGDGPERPQLEAQATALGLLCQFKGPQPGSAVREELCSARVFCVPSVRARTGDSEGLGIVFAEAQAMGVPVVSSSHGGIPEVVCNGITGLLAPERDHAQLAQHITRFFADETFWEDCRRNAVKWISANFDIRRQTSILEEIYEEVCKTDQEARDHTTSAGASEEGSDGHIGAR